MQDLFTAVFVRVSQAGFRDEGLTHETVSLEYYPLHSFVPYLTYYFVFRSHNHNESLSVRLSQAHNKRFNESNFKAVENK